MQLEEFTIFSKSTQFFQVNAKEIIQGLKSNTYNDVYHSIITVSKITETTLMSRTENGQIYNVRFPQQMVRQKLRMKHFF